MNSSRRAEIINALNAGIVYAEEMYLAESHPFSLDEVSMDIERMKQLLEKLDENGRGEAHNA